MPALISYDYAIVRIVPHVEREEFINVGVILFCRERRFLDARCKLDAARLAALAPDLDTTAAQAQLDLIQQICAGVGLLGKLTQAERFRWLTAPRSTALQVSPAHVGLCADPKAELDLLFKKLIA
jgi:hypothetical protein